MRSRRAWLGGGALAALLVASAPGEAAEDAALAACAESLREPGRGLEAARCFHARSRGSAASAEQARGVLERFVGEHDGAAVAYARLALGMVLADRGSPGRAQEHLGAALHRLEGAGDEAAVFDARCALADLAAVLGRFGEARRQLDLAEAAARDPVRRARLRLVRARAALAQRDYAAAQAHLDAAARAGAIPPSLQARLAFDQAEVLADTSRYAGALGHYRAAAARCAEVGDRFGRAWALQRAARMEGMLYGRVPAETFRATLAEAMEAARRSGNVQAEAEAALLVQFDFTRDAAGRRRLLELARARFREAGRPSGEAEALMGLAAFASGPDRRAEQTAIHEEALALARRGGDPWVVSRVLLSRAEHRWSRGLADESLADLMEILDLAEAIRDAQRDDLAQAWVASESAYAYYRASGRLLREPGRFRLSEPMDRAFRIMERLRARTLLGWFDAAGVTAQVGAAHPAARRRAGVLERLEGLGRRLAAPGLDPASRRRALEARASLEAEERALRARLVREDPSFARLRGLEPASLSQVQAALAEDQALVAYQLSYGPRRAGVDGGGSWCVVVTRDGAAAAPLADWPEVEDAVAVYLGLVDRGDDAPRRAGAHLRALLLDPALRELPGGVRRIVLVPDRSLHQLPFDALPLEDGKPLAARYATAVAPSATLWLRLREQPEPARGMTLALADPDHPGSGVPEGGRRWWRGRDRAPAPLPHARREAKRLVRRLGAPSRLLLGGGAGEADLVRVARGEPVRLLHLAAHAVVDTTRPERSAVLLAASGASDGRLTPGEIAALPVEGAVVVLSACRSAGGVAPAGEGPLGLTRAFLQAGARAVVASLWEVRDEDAAAFMGPFYEALASGHSVADALARARLALWKAGRPPSAWAAMVVVGDGDVAPFATGPRPSWRRPAAWAWRLGLTGLGLVLAGWALAALRRRAQGSPSPLR